MSVTGSNMDDKMVYWAAYRSPAEISELMNGVVSKEEVASRVVQILHDRNWLTAAQKRQIVLDSLFDLMKTYMGWAQDGSLPSAKLILNSSQEIRAHLDKYDQTNLADEMLTIQQSYAEKMGMAMSKGFEAMLQVIREAGLEITDERAVEILTQVSGIAFAEVDRYVEKLELQ